MAERPRDGESARLREERSRRLRERGFNPSTGWPRTHVRVGSPSPFSARSTEDRWVEGEIEEILRVLREHGPLGLPALRRHTRSRLWGPGRLSHALAVARRRGQVRRIGFRTFEAVD